MVTIHFDKDGSGGKRVVVPATSHRYESVESECRALLGATIFKSVGELIGALNRTLGIENIKQYGFVDTYYRRIDSSEMPESIRIREWTRYTLADGTEKPQKVQIIISKPDIEIYKGKPLSKGGKKSKEAFDTVEEAREVLAKQGLKPAFTVTKRDGVHVKVLGGESERRVACETVTCSGNGRSWSAPMIEIEVSSTDRDKVVAEYDPILAVLGVGASALTGEPMEQIASRNLGIKK